MFLNKAVALSLLALAFPCGLAAEAIDLGPIPEVHIECFATSPDAQSLSPDPTKDGTWLQFRRDRKQTGRSPLIGTITCPDVLWTYDYRARINWIAITPGTESGELSLPVEGETGQYFRAHEDYGPLIDLDGDRSDFEDPDGAGGHKIGDFLPALEGLERFSCEMASLRCSLQNRVDRAWETVWLSEEMPGFESAFNLGTPIIGDFDNDGEKEAAVVPWYDLHLLDLATGEIEQTGNFQENPYITGSEPGPTTGRAYGWFGAFNLDEDPKHEFIILGDAELFVSVFGWEDGILKEPWDHQFEAGVFLKQAAHVPGVNPVADIDGDGDMEIVTSVYNEGGDGLWHVLVFDALTGNIQSDLANRYIAGLSDVNGDGSNDLLLATTNGQVINPYGVI